MKRLIYIIIGFVFITSCEDFFNLERAPQAPWLDINEFDRAAIGAYNRIFANGEWGNIFDYITMAKNVTADDVGWVDKTDYSWGWYRDTENNKGFTDDIFTATYTVIASCNDVFKFVNDHNGNPFPEISAEDKKNNFDRVVGEMYFMRAYCYYVNVTTFCNAYVPNGPNDAKQIPLITELAKSYEDATNPTMGSVQEIYDLIINDLTQAYNLLPERFIDGKMHASYKSGRATKFAVATLLSRVYFQMGNYAKAKEYANFVIEQNGGDYDLSEDPIEAFNKSSLTRGKEVIMYIPVYDQTYGRRHYHATVYNHLWGFESECPWTAPYIDFDVLKRIGWMDNAKTDTTVNAKARVDKRFQQVLFLREPGNVPENKREPGRYYDGREYTTSRMIFANKLFRGPNEQGYTNIPVFRLAELYLTRSICLFKENDKTGAARDLNVVKKRAWDENVAGVPYEQSQYYVTANNITEQMIGDERLIEFFCEGDRLDYLRGLKVDIGNGERSSGSVPYTDKGFVWPVPVTEKSLNGNY